MITTVTLNPCIDRTVMLKNLKVGGHNRIDRTLQDVSGKGINVSVALQQLGVETGCLGFDYSAGGAAVTRFLQERSIPYWSVPVAGELRVNIKVTDTANTVMTELNERGNPVTPGSVAALFDRLEEALDHARRIKDDRHKYILLENDLPDYLAK